MGFQTVCGKMELSRLSEIPLPCILHWDQEHFVVLYRVRSGGKHFYVADPGKGLVTYKAEEFQEKWICVEEGGMEKGVALLLDPTNEFYQKEIRMRSESHSLSFLVRYFKRYRRQLLLMALTLLMASLMQLVLPLLTQKIVDVGIKEKDIPFIYLVLAGQLMLTLSRTLVDFWRRWLLLRVSMHVNIDLISDFFTKLVRLPMSFFDTKLMGDLQQRMNDHQRVNIFITQQSMGMMFAATTFVVFGIVLWTYHPLIFAIFLGGSMLYGVWLSLFLRRRKVIDY